MSPTGVIRGARIPPRSPLSVALKLRAMPWETRALPGGRIEISQLEFRAGHIPKHERREIHDRCHGLYVLAIWLIPLFLLSPKDCMFTAISSVT